MSNPDRPTVETLLAHSEFVRGLARTLVSDPATADDAVQQAWLAACEAPPADARSPRGWLATVTRNAVRKRKRGEARRDAREEAVARPEASVPSAAAIAEREEARRKLVDAVLGLAEPYRSAIVLRFLEELPPREVAARLEVPVETARTRIKRGLEQLRGVLDGKFAGRTAWGLALIPLATTGGAAKAAVTGAGFGGGVAVAATLFLGSAITLGFLLGGGPDDDGALGGGGVAQAPEGGVAEDGREANAPAPLPAAAPPEEDAESDTLRRALEMVANLKANQADEAKRNAAAADAPIVAGGGTLALRATVADAFVPFEGTLKMTAHFENRGGDVVRFFTGRFATIDAFPRWRLYHEDGRVFAPAPWMGQSMWQEGLAGTIHDIAPGAAWTRTVSVQRVVAVKEDGSTDWKSALPMPAGRYRVSCGHTQQDNKLPHNRRAFRTEHVAVPGVWTGSLQASDFWVQVGEPAEPRLAVTQRGTPRGGDPCVVEIAVRNPRNTALPLDGPLVLTLGGKAQRTGVATVDPEHLQPAGATPLPDPLVVPAGATLRARVDLAGLAWMVKHRRGANLAAHALYALMPQGTGHCSAAWRSGEGASMKSIAGDPAWITVRQRPLEQSNGLGVRLLPLGGSRIRVEVYNDGPTTRRVCTRLSWPAEVRLTLVDPAAPTKTRAAVQGGDMGDLSFPDFDLDRLRSGLAWHGDAYERPGPLTVRHYQELLPGAAFGREIDLAKCVADGLPEGRYRVHAVWRSLNDGRHLGLEPAVTAVVKSAPVEIVVE